MNPGGAAAPTPQPQLAAAAASGQLYREDGGPIDELTTIRKGVMFKKCRSGGDQKPWKKRWFLLRGCTLLYYHDSAMAGRPKIFLHMFHDTEVRRMELSESPQGHGLQINQGTHRLMVDTGSASDQAAWAQALERAKDLPILLVDEDSQSDDHAPSAMVRFKMNLAGAIATSRVGRKVIRHYLDDSAKTLIACLLELAHTLSGSKQARTFESAIFDVCARIAVIIHENKLPTGLDTRTLYEETLSFCQDFLMYSRDRLLRELRGEDAEVSTVDFPELLRSSEVIVQIWRTILQPNVTSKALRRFDEVCGYYLCEEKLKLILCDPEHEARLRIIHSSLKELMERY